MAAAINMRAKYKTSVKDPGVPGVLNTMVQIFNTSGSMSSATKRNDSLVKKRQMEMEKSTEGLLRPIEGHRFSKEGNKHLLNLTQEVGGCIFEFDKFSDHDVCLDYVGKVL